RGWLVHCHNAESINNPRTGHGSDYLLCEVHKRWSARFNCDVVDHGVLLKTLDSAGPQSVAVRGRSVDAVSGPEIRFTMQSGEIGCRAGSRDVVEHGLSELEALWCLGHGAHLDPCPNFVVLSSTGGDAPSRAADALHGPQRLFPPA